MKTGKIISDLRKEKGMSQTELANKTGISQVMVGKYERGDASPSIEVAKKNSRCLGSIPGLPCGGRRKQQV